MWSEPAPIRTLEPLRDERNQSHGNGWRDSKADIDERSVYKRI
jgi:hypothetical protein